MESFQAWWQRVVATQSALGIVDAAMAGGLALILVLAVWPVVRTLITVCHEAGHAVVALLAGRRLSGIRVHADTSGLTVTRGRPTGPGMVATLFAGYAAAAVCGVVIAALVASGHAAGALWLAVVLLALMLLKIRNLYGAAAVLVIGVGVGLVSWYAPAITPWVATAIAWLLLLAAPRPVVELFGNHNPGSDAAQLARITVLPRTVWILLWLVVTLALLVLGGWLLLPGVGEFLARAGTLG